VQGSARAFARLNPDMLPSPEPGEELPGELASDPRQRERLRKQEATAALGERPETGLRAAYLDDTARERDALFGWLGKVDAISSRPGEALDERVRSLAAITRRLLDQQAARLVGEVGEPDAVRVARQRERHGRYPTRYLGRAAVRSRSRPSGPSSGEVAAMSAEQGGMACYRLVGVTDERDSCDCCGRTNLKRVVVLHDGDDHVFIGPHCAAKLLGKPVGDVNRQATAAQRQRERAERTARRAAQRETERAEALAAGFRADLDGINASVLARACVRFAATTQTIASRRADQPERPRRVRPLPGGHPRPGPARPRPQGGGRP
jgi:hypothetical protein